MTVARMTAAIAALTLCSGLIGCSSSRSASVSIDNQSSVPLQVELTMPARGVFGRKPSLEGYVMRVAPGASWSSTSDTRKWSMEPNPEQAFRVVVMEHESRPVIAYQAAWFDTGKKACHLVLRGDSGGISCSAGAAADGMGGEVKQLTPRARE